MRICSGALALALVLGTGVSAPSRPAQATTPLAALEGTFRELRQLTDEIELAHARGVPRATTGEPLTALAARWSDARARVDAQLAALGDRFAPSAGAPPLSADDRLALDEMRRVLGSDLAKPPAAEPPSEATSPECAYDAAALSARGDVLEALSARVYACFGQAAAQLSLDGRPLDRLTVLGLLAITDAPAERRRLFLALEPVWRSLNGDGGAGSPYRRLLALRTREPGFARGMVERKADALGLPPAEIERWIVAILEAWRDAHAGTRVEPWDFHYASGAASRALSARITLADLRRLNLRAYRDLGADVDALGVRYDLDPRPGKTPVAFTTFGRRGRTRAGTWEATQPWVFATYRTGGFDNLLELLHETGHALHLSAIRGRPAWLDWPDDDTFTEAVADLAAVDAYEPEWQRRYLGLAASPEAGLRARYASVALDAAWSLFELRLHRDPALDPNQVWAEITSSYLGLVPHPEWSWWALRGQLIDAPGYLSNYAVGAVLTADLRARLRRQRGPSAAGDPGWYAWVSERLFRYGRARPAREVVEGFLGRKPSPEALLADLRRTAPADR